MKNRRALISIAQRNLLETPFDIAHDIHHHYNVWKNCYLITSMEDLSPQMDLLEIAAWWHDYERGSKEHKALRGEMKKLKMDDEYIEQVVDVINSHSYSDERTTSVEGQILFDADKIEYINPDRFVWIGEGTLDGLMEAETAKMYGKALMDRLDYIVDTMTFRSSKQLFATNMSVYLYVVDEQKIRYAEFLEYVKKDVLEKKLKEIEAELEN